MILSGYMRGGRWTREKDALEKSRKMLKKGVTVDMADVTQNGRRDFVKSFAYTLYPCIDEVSPSNYYEQYTNILKYLITQGRS